MKDESMAIIGTLGRLKACKLSRGLTRVDLLYILLLFVHKCKFYRLNTQYVDMYECFNMELT